MFQFDPSDDSFTRFHNNPEDPNSLSNDRVTCIIEENEEILWVGTERGLNRLNRSTGQFKRFISDQSDSASLSYDHVRELYIDRSGTLWVGTGFIFDPLGPTQGGLNKYHREDQSFTRYYHQPGNPQSLWGDAVKAIYEDSQGNFWVGSKGGLQLMDRESGTFKRMTENPDVDKEIFAPGIRADTYDMVYSILEDPFQQLWIFNLHQGNLGSVALVDLQSNQMEIIEELADIIPWQTMQSKDGTIWLAGAGVGGKVHKIQPVENQVKFLPFIPTGEGSGISFEGLVAQGDSIIWGKTSSVDGTPQVLGLGGNMGQNWGLRDLQEISLENISVDPIFAEYVGKGLVIDNAGRFWGCTGSTGGGIFSMHPSQAGVKQYLHDPEDPNSLPSNYILELLPDRNGNIWLASHAAVYQLDPYSMRFSQYLQGANDPGSFHFPLCMAMFEDREGFIWVGGAKRDGSGLGVASLSRIDPASGSIHEAHIPDDILVPVIAITQNHEGDIFYLVQNRTLAVLRKEDISKEVWDQSQGYEEFMGGAIQGANNLIADDQGVLWLTDLEGRILRLDSETQALTVIANQPGLAFTEGRAFKITDGTIYFDYQDGLVAINPSDRDIYQLQRQSPVRFTEFFLNGQSIDPENQPILNGPVWQISRLDLSYDQANFGLRFSAFDFKEPENSQYQVRLLPYETQWRRVEGDPLVNYYQLPPGNYTLEVKGSDSNGIWAKETAKMDIHIAPPWWKSRWAYGIYTFLMVAGLLAVHRFQKERVIRKERELIRDRELAQAKEIEKAYTELKNTQDQLIHSEKMASLGELTAGIAHEIQNPLNFVNNFSEVNKELLEELKEAQQNGHKQEVEEIVSDILTNEEKIVHHGKRAEAIVKSMLQHSRTSSGEKVPTDINALAEEYLRLAYHGFRAKDKSFKASYQTDLQKNLPKIEVVPQDIGRVLLNLINNAFQAVSAKALAKVGGDYNPEVVVATKLGAESIEIIVKDNGPGIPEDIKGKIFQPFFTTKAAGEGTGLGLSLSYDIVTKGHGGTIEVTSEVEQGTAFLIKLPY